MQRSPSIQLLSFAEQLLSGGSFATQRGGARAMLQKPPTHCGVPPFAPTTHGSPMTGIFTHVFVAGSQSDPVAQISMAGLSGSPPHGDPRGGAAEHSNVPTSQ